MAVIQSAIPMDDYSLKVVMTNHNRLLCSMKPYLDTVQYCPLKDKQTWKHIEITDHCLNFRGNTCVELPMDTLLELLKRDKNSSEDSVIDQANIDEKGVLHIILQNANQIDMEVAPLVQYPIFSPLIQKELLRAMKNNRHSLLWKNDSIALEIPFHTILNYFL